MLFEVELIINNVPLTNVYPNTIKTCLTHRQLLYSSNTISTDKMNRISHNVWSWWRHVNNAVNLRETQRTAKLNINSQNVNVNNMVPVYDKMVQFWRIAIVIGVLEILK